MQNTIMPNCTDASLMPMCDRLIEKGISSGLFFRILPGGAQGPQCEETQAAFVQDHKPGLSLAGLSSSSYDGSQPLLLSSIQMDQRFYFGWAASVLGADADHAGEDDDGNEAAQEKPGGEKGEYLDFLFFVSRCRWLGRKFVEILGSKLELAGN